MFWFSLELESWFNSQIISSRGGTLCKSDLQSNLWDFWWRLRMVAWKSQDRYVNTQDLYRLKYEDPDYEILQSSEAEPAAASWVELTAPANIARGDQVGLWTNGN